jgi:UDP-glucose 4-epimerase
MGARVLLVDSLIPAYGGNLFNIDGLEQQLTVNIADVRDQYSMNYLVQNQDIMFNLAGTLSHVDSMVDPFTDLEINCRSQLSILESCRHHNPDIRIVFAGTRGQYGKARSLPVDEQHPLHPADVNGINNNAGEAYHILYYEVYGLRATSLRLTNTYGPRHQMHHPRQGIINWFIRQAIEGDEITIFGDGKQVRDTNFVEDVVDAFLLAGANEQAHGETFNLGGEPMNLLDLVALIGTITENLRWRCVPYPESAKAIEVGDYIADHSKAEHTLGWQPSVAIRDGLERTIAFYREHREHYW